MANFSHANCTHPSTKVARAKCRREMKKATPAPTFTNPILAAVEAAMNGPKMLMPAPARVHVSVNALVLRRENWKDYKGRGVTVRFTDGDVIASELTGWSERNIQFKDENGKTVRRPVADLIEEDAVRLTN